MKKIEAFKFTIVSACLILVALLLPSSSFPKMPSTVRIDKVAHFFLFMLFSLSYLLEFRRYNGKLPGFLHATLLILTFIVISELMQLLTKSRHFEFLDMAFDTAGAVVAFLAVKAALWLKRP